MLSDKRRGGVSRINPQDFADTIRNLPAGELKAGSRLFYNVCVESGDSVGEIFKASDPDGIVFISIYNDDQYGESTLYFRDQNGKMLTSILTTETDGVIVQKAQNAMFFWPLSSGELHQATTVANTILSYQNLSSSFALLTARKFSFS